jgi:hypothetical protein
MSGANGHKPGEEPEVLDGVPVVASRGDLAPVPAAQATVPARQAAALAATSFIAGAATAAVVGRQARRLTRRRRRRGGMGEVLATNSFLIDVHLLRRG